MAARVVLALLLAVLAEGRAAADAPPVADLELGARVGGRVNLGGLGPGGAHLGGVLLYRITQSLWFQGGLLFSLGGAAPTCYLARDQSTTCDPAPARGAGVHLRAGVRWFPPGARRFVPFIGGGLGLSYVSFSGDDLAGFALPLWLAGGGRARVAPGVAVGGEVVLDFGPTRLGRGQGWGPNAAVSVLLGVDFAL